MLVVYRTGHLAAKALLDARWRQVVALLEHNDNAQCSLANARNDLAASRSELQRQRAAKIKPEDAAPSPVIINLAPGSKRVEHDDAGRIVRITEEDAEQSTRVR